MFTPDIFDAVKPQEMPSETDCVFYTSMNFPDGTSVTGPWDIRGRFNEYIGNYPIRGKTLLDVGTASGFLAFSAEEEGAIVTALDGRHASEYDQLHFAGLPFHNDRRTHDINLEAWFVRLKKSFWFCWHKKASSVEVVYAPLASLPYWDRRFDVVVAGAILEHLADPVSLIWSLTQLAKEAVIIAYTPVAVDENKYMVTANPWDNPTNNFTWWTLSSGLYRRIFANVGFDMEILPAGAVTGGIVQQRSTIVARRIRSE